MGAHKGNKTEGESPYASGGNDEEDGDHGMGGMMGNKSDTIEGESPYASGGNDEEDGDHGYASGGNDEEDGNHDKLFSLKGMMGPAHKGDKTEGESPYASGGNDEEDGDHGMGGMMGHVNATIEGESPYASGGGGEEQFDHTIAGGYASGGNDEEDGDHDKLFSPMSPSQEAEFDKLELKTKRPAIEAITGFTQSDEKALEALEAHSASSDGQKR